jgi:hypothetical protein
VVERILQDVMLTSGKANPWPSKRIPTRLLDGQIFGRPLAYWLDNV